MNSAFHGKVLCGNQASNFNGFGGQTLIEATCNGVLGEKSARLLCCQSARKADPLSARNIDPLDWRRSGPEPTERIML